jgi:hypothetical protein
MNARLACASARMPAWPASTSASVLNAKSFWRSPIGTVLRDEMRKDVLMTTITGMRLG